MSEWKTRRFWTSATVSDLGEGFGVELDGRPVRTPGKLPLLLPTRALAEALAAEWDAQEGLIDPRAMPLTRAANSAIERVATQRAAVIEALAEYGDTDLVCYRAETPDALVLRQSRAWDPLLHWAQATYGARLIAVAGVVHRAQPPAALQRLKAPLHGMSDFQLTGFHDLVGLSGSLVIALAAAEGAFEAEDLWTRSRIDENWQRDQWGPDEDADNIAEGKRRGFLSALRFYRLSEETP